MFCFIMVATWIKKQSYTFLCSKFDLTSFAWVRDNLCICKGNLIAHIDVVFFWVLLGLYVYIITRGLD